jgi:spermidine/putrescine-binding protein
MYRSKVLWIALSLLVVVSLVLTACTPPPTPTEAPQEPPPTEAPTEPPAVSVSGNLVMLDWAGYEIPEFWGAFKAKYPDVQVDFSFLTESAEAYSKLQSGFEADLVHPCSNFWKLLVDENLVQPIDTSKLSNWDSVIASLAKEGEFNGKQYWIPWDWGFESILVRKDLVTTVPTSWADIWNPEYAGHISINDSGEAAHIWASLALGFDPWDQTEEEYAQVKQKLMDLAPSVLAYWAGQTDLDQMLASGDAWLGVGAWNASYVSLLGEGLDVEYITPKEGRTGYLCGFGIPTTSKNVDLALEMIDAYLAPDAMAYLANAYGYGIANEDAIPLVDPKMAEQLGLQDPDVISKTIFYKSITAEQRELWTNTWSEVKTSQ